LKATIIRLAETGSTNSYAIKLLSRSRPEEGSVIITDHQTQGKGTDHNTWESEKGKNLTFSLILYPTFTADQQFILNKAISLGICDFLQNVIHRKDATIKWPNDIYIGDKKVCGILIQNSVMGNKLEYVVVGIGLNVNQMLFTGDAPNPVSLKMISGMEYKLNELLLKLLRSIFERYTHISLKNTAKVETDYQSALYRLMEWHKYIVNNVEINARITRTNAFGQLLLENEAGEIIVCDLKEVKFQI